MSYISRADLDAFKARVSVGSNLRCIENTYSMAEHGIDRAGLVATITKPGVNVMSATANGKPWRWTWPKNLRDVVSIDGDRITYKIEGRGDHTVTWEIVSPETELIHVSELQLGDVCQRRDGKAVVFDGTNLQEVCEVGTMARRLTEAERYGWTRWGQS